MYILHKNVRDDEDTRDLCYSSYLEKLGPKSAKIPDRVCLEKWSLFGWTTLTSNGQKQPRESHKNVNRERWCYTNAALTESDALY